MLKKWLLLIFISNLLLTSHAQKPKTYFLKDFILEDINGRAYNLDSLKGKIVYVDCWYPACSPCRGEMPHSKLLQSRISKMGFDKKIVFLTISFKQDRNEWRKALKEIPVPGSLHLYAPNGRYSNIFVPNNNGFPTYRIFNAKGELDKTIDPSPSEIGYVDFVLFAVANQQLDTKTAKKIIREQSKNAGINQLKDLILQDFTKRFSLNGREFQAEYDSLMSQK